MHKTYRIGEVADLLSLKAYVLRFWETEFPQLAPLRTGKGQRLYTEEHVRLARRIQQLVHEQGLTLDGARRVLKQEGRNKTAEQSVPAVTALSGVTGGAAGVQRGGDSASRVLLQHFRQELLELRALLHAGGKR